MERFRQRCCTCNLGTCPRGKKCGVYCRTPQLHTSSHQALVVIILSPTHYSPHTPERRVLGTLEPPQRGNQPSKTLVHPEQIWCYCSSLFPTPQHSPLSGLAPAHVMSGMHMRDSASVCISRSPARASLFVPHGVHQRSLNICARSGQSRLRDR